MRRETTNRIRWVIEDILPPALRDGALFRALARLAWGRHVDHLADFRARAPFLSRAEYVALYRDHPRVHDDTDNSAACIARVIAEVVGQSVCDVGCGTGFLIRRVAAARPGLVRAAGVDVVCPPARAGETIEFHEATAEALPFGDDAFDTVICTHVIEHILDYRAAIAELRRVARRRLIIVVPREREALYTFNPHFNFFPYVHSFLRAMAPVPHDHRCEAVGRDIYYREERGGAGA